METTTEKELSSGQVGTSTTEILSMAKLCLNSHLLKIMHGKMSPDVYEGQWNNDQKHGLGLLKVANGPTLSGLFINDKFPLLA